MTQGNKKNLTRLLIIDDDIRLCRLVKEYLAPFGYDVEMAHLGHEGLDMALSGAFQVIILDVMMPGMDGFEVLRKLRQKTDIPVLMLTSRGDETDRIVGLEIGADDYLPKTFSSRELLARLRAVTRRSFLSEKEKVFSKTETLERGSLKIEVFSRSVFLNGRKLELTPLEFDLLLNLAKGAGRVFTRDQLMNMAVGRNYDIFDRSIDMHISSIRKKLGDNPSFPKFIKTIRSVGYMFLKEESAEQ